MKAIVRYGQKLFPSFFFLGFFLICTCNNLIHCRSLKKKTSRRIGGGKSLLWRCSFSGKKKYTYDVKTDRAVVSAAVKVL